MINMFEVETNKKNDDAMVIITRFKAFEIMFKIYVW